MLPLCIPRKYHKIHGLFRCFRKNIKTLTWNGLTEQNWCLIPHFFLFLFFALLWLMFLRVTCSSSNINSANIDSCKWNYDFHWCIQNPIKHLRLSFLQNLFTANVWQGSKYASEFSRSGIKKLLLKLRNIHRKTSVLEPFFNKVAGRDSNTSVFLEILPIF